MCTNIVIEDDLTDKAMQFSGTKTKKTVEEETLRLFIQLKGQFNIRDLKGKLRWEGNLNLMRSDI